MIIITTKASEGANITIHVLSTSSPTEFWLTGKERRERRGEGERRGGRERERERERREKLKRDE